MSFCYLRILQTTKCCGTLTILTSMFLFFTVPARVSTIGRVIYVPQNSDLDLPCRIVGDPLPTRKWFKNGRELSSDGMLNHALSSSRYMLIWFAYFTLEHCLERQSFSGIKINIYVYIQQHSHIWHEQWWFRWRIEVTVSYTRT